MKRPRRKDGFAAAFIKLAKVAFLVLLCYLIQVSVMPHLKFMGLVPNVMMICIAILTVSLGKKYAFASGAVFGILLDSLATNMETINLVIYPALALLCAQIFADMSDIKRELMRIRIAQRQAERGAANIANPYQRKRFRLSFRRVTADDRDPHLRILLNALMLTALFEVVMMLYFALGGIAIGMTHIRRLMITLLYTALASLIMFPARAFLGMYQWRSRKAQLDGQQSIDITDKALDQIALVPDLPDLKQIAVPMTPDLAPIVKAEDSPTEPGPEEKTDEV